MYCMVSEHMSFLSDNSIGGEHGDEPDDEVGDSYPGRFKKEYFRWNHINSKFIIDCKKSF